MYIRCIVLIRNARMCLPSLKNTGPVDDGGLPIQRFVAQYKEGNSYQWQEAKSIQWPVGKLET